MRLRKFLIFGVLLFMVVGFATVSVTFNFKGIASIAANEDDFRVSFSKAVLDGYDVAPTVVSTDGLRLKYQTNELKYAKDDSILDFAITNNSKLYDAKIAVTCDDLENDDVTLKVKLGADRINAGENVIGRVTITLNKTLAKDAEAYKLDVSCRLKLTALERTDKGEDAPDLEDSLYKEDVLNGADPVLADGMIPVVIADDGTVTYANKNVRWYRYGQREWANAIILKEDIDSMYNVGNVIKEEDIESYFVWIPRYKYKLWNASTEDMIATEALSGSSANTIEIEFENKDTEVSSGTNNGEWLTHPAFTSFDVNGLWVGKFETGYAGATSDLTAKNNVSDSSKIIIKPNVYSWRYVSVENIFTSYYNYKRDLDSHMIKNTEWGAVAYLSHSKFGIDKEININNNISHKTGYSAQPSTNQSVYRGESGDGASYNAAYNTEVGYLASTTGNITGVYDMSGGTHEYVAAYVSNKFGGSGLTARKLIGYDAKYLDVYNELSDTTTYQYRILGDATGEMGKFSLFADKDGTERYHNSWYNDNSNFVNQANPWFTRGGGYEYGVLAGSYYFDTHTGGAQNTVGSRVVLAPTK